MEHRILSEHFRSVKTRLLEYSKHFDIADHGDIKGYGREALVQEFLKTHLPDQVNYLTGEIIDPDDHRSGQIDIILQSSNQPKIPLVGNLHLAFIDSVIAALEVKSNLTTQHLAAALDHCKKIKALKRTKKLANRNATTLESVPYVIFAFKGPRKQTLLDALNEYAEANGIALDMFCPEMIVVLESDYYLCKNDGWQFPYVEGGYWRDWTGLPHETLVGIYNYLNNLIQSYLGTPHTFSVGPYFDKPK